MQGKRPFHCPWQGCTVFLVAVIVFLLAISPASAVTDVYSVISLQLQIREQGTGIPVSDVTVYLDGTPAGTTDASGSITLSRIIVKSHTLKFVKSGYDDYTMSYLPHCTSTSCSPTEYLDLSVLTSNVPVPENSVFLDESFPRPSLPWQTFCRKPILRRKIILPR